LIANLLVLSDPNPGYEAERVAGVRTLRRYGIITKYPSGPLVVPSVVAAIKAAIAVPEEELEEGTHGLRDDVFIFQNCLCSFAGKDTVA
jgi:hypothetical protein